MTAYRKANIEAVIAVDDPGVDFTAQAYLELLLVLKDAVRRRLGSSHSSIVPMEYPVVSFEMKSDDCDRYGSPLADT